MYIFPTEDKENYNPDSKTYSPARLVNQKRYKVLRSLTMNSVNRKHEEAPLKERTNLLERLKEEEICDDTELMKDLEFEDESERRFGI